MILICTPIFLPVARAYGIDPIHFGWCWCSPVARVWSRPR